MSILSGKWKINLNKTDGNSVNYLACTMQKLSRPSLSTNTKIKTALIIYKDSASIYIYIQHISDWERQYF